ncbi:alpha/beta hydrolase [Aquabacterium sp.]|uniref:alpha/beta hydrolase n=1 Tax=Aquabacterium TaxID=92793 RepID=UPI001DF0C299|nr:alpha/beta hydrolase [Aquabacterium sp.]MBT9608678.1 alpha/beta hydrolase [Aquabacterium sp.]|tara:strand:- start:751 stop:1734 length:984 start_codon:yes stop_codon:yes gene_type:complete
MSAVPKTPATATARPVIRRYEPPAGLQESIVAAILRVALKVTLKPFLGPPWPFAVQRMSLALGSSLMPQDGRATVHVDRVGSIEVDRVVPKAAKGQPRHAILYLHGGAFVAGSPRTHRSITRALSALTGAQVLVPHYRLAPESPFPAQLDDCVQCYKQLLQEGYTADRISIAGDSAGGNLTFMTAIAAVKQGLPAPASLVMMSPALSLHPLPDTTAYERVSRDPMIRLAWADDVERAMKVPADHPLANPMAQDLSQLPPSLTQVGDDEVLFDNAVWVVEHATAAGRVAELEIYMKRWHVFQAHASMLPSSGQALARQAAFMKRHWAV